MILLLASDPGGANMLRSLVEPIREAGFALQCYGLGVGLQMFLEAGHAVLDLGEAVPVPSPEEFVRLLQERRPALVLTATSGVRYEEKFLWAAARSLGIPSVAVLDQWVNYGIRFSRYTLREIERQRATREHSFLPDVICIMDEFARREMCAEGLPDERLRITGHSHLEGIRAAVESERQRGSARAELRLEPDAKVLLFVSEPLSTAYGSARVLGYDERTIFSELLNALEDLDAGLDAASVVLLIKPHPKESPGYYEEVIRTTTYRHISLRLETSSGTAKLLSQAHVVVGMGSMVLIEAAVCGLPVISAQIGGIGPDPLVLSRVGWLQAARTQAELSAQLRRALLEAPHTGRPYPLREASQGKIIQVIQERLGMNDRKASPLALHGGPKTRSDKFPASRTIGQEEQRAAERVLKSGILSRFLGVWHEDFYGGPEVQALEREWADYFEVEHAIAMNSATSALYAAVGAAGIEPGDEIIVSPFTMSASAVAPLVYSAIPVFADIERDYYCLDPASVEARITARTRAIIVVDIFGLPYDVLALRQIADKHQLTIIEDCAQAPGALHGSQFAGTLGDIGIYSLNYHKHIHTGEGGILVTDNDELAERARLIRNHAESVVLAKKHEDLSNMVGFNYRMTELEAALGREQLRKLKSLLKARQDNVEYLRDRLAEIPCLKPAQIRPDCTHSYYLHTLQFDSEVAGCHRDRFVEALRAELPLTELRETEGVKVGGGYVLPIYLQPMFQRKIAFGSKGHPWSTFKSSVDYSPGLCPVVEDLHRNVLVTHEFMRPSFTRNDLDDVVRAFHKVFQHRQEL